ncbi:MAG: NAD(P)-dependent oxidoreductase [Burkholderiales bacterium]|jgi:3-hydroxyisobutyrate dehydrogenase-like beta-hydroxyacid dehydrogenase
MNTSLTRIGFIGLGVMGEPICSNLARKSGLPVMAYDLDPAPVQRLAAEGVTPAQSPAAIMAGCDLIVLSLPSGEVVERLARQPDGLLAHLRDGQVIIDTGTTGVDTTRALALDCSRRQAHWVDAPVARTRAAAIAGTLSVMVGASETLFARIEPLIATFAEEITRCGEAGAGQVVKILNNMVLFETVMALGEARLMAERAGVDPTLLFDTLTKGSADSFALRNHGMKALLPGEFPERAFSVRYALKDLRYALDMAEQSGVDARGARTVQGWFDAAIESGLGDRYHPVIGTLMGGQGA